MAFQFLGTILFPFGLSRRMRSVPREDIPFLFQSAFRIVTDVFGRLGRYRATPVSPFRPAGCIWNPPFSPDLFKTPSVYCFKDVASLGLLESCREAARPLRRPPGKSGGSEYRACFTVCVKAVVAFSIPRKPCGRLRWVLRPKF